MFQICGVTPLFSDSNVPCQGLTYDGCFYYLSEKRGARVIKLDKHFQTQHIFATCRVYSSLCYDEGKKCFWATSGECCEIFCLSCDMKEMGNIALPECIGLPTGISYCKTDGGLLLSTDDKIVRITVCDPPAFKTLRECAGATFTGVTCAAHCYLYHYLEGGQKLRLVDKNGVVIEQFCPPPGHTVEQAVYLGRNECCDEFLLLTSKRGCQPFLIEARLDVRLMGEHCPCPPKPPHPPCPPKPPHPHPHPHPCCEKCGEVLESIALEETGLAHILNAEGEKIQKALETATCVEELLAVNREVNRTIINVTNLEQVLYAKLDALRDCCKEGGKPCPPKPPHPPCPPKPPCPCPCEEELPQSGCDCEQ